jgi:tight adherence protein B
MLAAAILVFCSISLLTLGLAMLFTRRRSQTVQRLMVARAAATMAQSRTIDADLSILRDQALSGIGLLQRFLLKFRFGSKLKTLLEQADVKMKTGTLVLCIAVFAMTGLLLGIAFKLWAILTVLTGSITGSLPILVVLHLRTRRFGKFEAQFPDAIDLLSRAIRAGHAFNSGIKMIADEMPDPVGMEFRRVFEEQNFGLPLKTAMMNLLDRINLIDLRLFVVAVMVQRQSGGNLAELLGKISETIRERFRIMRQLKIHTAQAKLTGIILVCLPPALGFIIYMLNYEYMKVMFENDWGLKMMYAAVAMQGIGLVWIRKIVNIEV